MTVIPLDPARRRALAKFGKLSDDELILISRALQQAGHDADRSGQPEAAQVNMQLAYEAAMAMASPSRDQLQYLLDLVRSIARDPSNDGVFVR